MIQATAKIEDGDWVIILHEGSMEISMPLVEAQHLTKELIATFQDIMRIENDG